MSSGRKILSAVEIRKSFKSPGGGLTEVLKGASLDVNRHAYIRLERIHFDPSPKYLKLSGEVINYDYNGITTKYHVNTCGEIIRIIKVNDGRPIYQNGEKIDMYLNPADIMQY